MVQKLPPVWLIRAIQTFRTFLLQFNRKLFPGNVVLYEQFQNFWLLPSIYVAAKLDIAGELKEKPLTAEELAARLKVDAGNLARILRALSSQGIFAETGDGKYQLNSMSKGLLDAPGSLRHMILHHLGPVNWNLMSNLEYSVRTGKDAFTNKYGKPTYEYLAGHPEEYSVFDKSMSNLSDLGLAPILQTYDFSRFSIIADIGGGEGFLLANILQNNPLAKGILFDTPDALLKSQDIISFHHVENRITVVPGDFFSAIPAGADLYMLKNIVHNWGDRQSIDLLRKIHGAMKDSSTLLIIEMIVPPGNEPSLAKLLDIQMMASMPGGLERTLPEYAELLRNSGFTLTRTISTIAPISLIEARKSQ
jgi:hypothetical protein